MLPGPGNTVATGKAEITVLFALAPKKASAAATTASAPQHAQANKASPFADAVLSQKIFQIFVRHAWQFRKYD
ncbi:hypothetical protein [Botryobacter ruber]|uniref:hypothetical protein n=1 Tax=Botryobacter ruber TaxID=2171629 RepID=UPI000F649B3C|nr:hypothetical protein [Botryobacter ruber]